MATAARPKCVSQWSVHDVLKWFRKTCNEYFSLYSELFLAHDIKGETATYERAITWPFLSFSSLGVSPAGVVAEAEWA